MAIQTLLAMRTRVRDWLGRDSNSLPDTVINDMLNESQDHITEEAAWSWAEGSTAVLIPAGQSSAALPVTVIMPRRCSYITATGGTTIWMKYFATPGAMLELYHAEPAGYLMLNPGDVAPYQGPQPITTTGNPMAFTLWGRNLTVERPVTADTTFTLEYYGYVADLVNDTDHNIVTDGNWFMLLLHVLAHVTAYGMEDERVPLWEQAYQEHLSHAISVDSGFRSGPDYVDTNEAS